MLTIFSSCKPFRGEDDRAQRNAIGSWKSLRPRPEILILGDDEGAAEIAEELELIHVPGIERSRFGKPLVSSVFKEAQKYAKHDYVCYVNSDIVLMSDFMRAFDSARSKFRDFLLIGKRYDLDVNEYMQFDSDWEERLQARAASEAELYPLKGIDYFVVQKGKWVLPPFVLGSIRWDNWMILEGLKKRIPVIDATQAVMAIHQNHEITRALGQDPTRFDSDPIALNNLKIYGDEIPAFDNLDATHEIRNERIRRRLSPSRLLRWMETEQRINPRVGLFRKWEIRLFRLAVNVYKKLS